MIKFSKVLIIATLGIILITSVPYYKTTIYNFTEPKPFSGHEFYNPYKNIGSQWIKANFHAHTIMHNGLANGENTPDELYTVYDSMKYDLPCISNYNSILPNLLNRHPFLTAYEHGLNGGAIHQLVLNNEQANRFDFPFWQSKHHKQFIINDQKNFCNKVI